MPIRLDTQAADFTQRFRAFLDTKREAAEDVEQAVRGIIAEVRQERRPRLDRADQQI